jgi:ATP-dependent helicase/nuclease subunit A
MGVMKMAKNKSTLMFSAKQLEALDLSKQNMLVSAGAGSGKTAVLVERLYRIITDQNVPLDRLLVLTFTEAGAQEFKNRIKAKLAEDPQESHKAFGIDTADITTFDAYSLKILKKYGYLLDLDANLTNLDESIEQVLIKRAFDKVMIDEYDNPSVSLKTFAKRFLMGDDFTLFKIIYAFHKTTKLVIDPESFVAS